MRPVDRGPEPRLFAEYGDALPELWARLGRFCSYCGRFFPSGLAVEHKRPRSRYPDEELLWTNFLLGCLNCNSSKGHPRIRLDRYLWPDTDNTLRAFIYTSDGRICASRSVRKTLRRKATRTIRLLGLDKYPGAHHKPTDRDLRWSDRRMEWTKASQCRDELRACDTPRQRDLIVTLASNGIFSVWWAVFEGDPDMRSRLRAAFVGTCSNSFDANGKLQARPRGQL